MTQILAVHSERFAATSGGHSGFVDAPLDVFFETVKAAGIFTGPRPLLETMPEFRQFISYALIEQYGKFACYRRGKSGGEDRLHDKWSIGIGGHVDVPDFVYDRDGTIIPYATLKRNVRREVEEETSITVNGCSFLGYIADSSDAVGRVHLGVVYQISGQRGQLIESREDCLTDFQMLPLHEIDALPLESWSRLIVNKLRERL